ncbi:MAG: PAS domain S-box-containing protein [Flavobacteriaceae bacterium]|jgi:PAS domain S-box-containing protein
MLKKEQHRLLRRQLKKAGLIDLDNPNFAKFLNTVNEAYKSFDKDVKHIEHILEESSNELFIKKRNLRSERDKIKNKLENIVDNFVGVIFETDLKGNYTFLNNAWVTYSGIPLSESIGRNFQEFLSLENIEGKKKIQEVFVYKKRYIKFIFKNTKNDKKMWFEVKAKLINDEHGNPEKYIGSIVDITNLKETEIKLKKASESKDAFLSTMSHEIRTPLNAVTGLTNILLMEDYLPKQEESLRALKYSGEHLLGLINDILDFNKIESGNIKIIEKDFSLNYFLENIKSHFLIRTREKGLVFKIIKNDDVPDNIIGDKLKLAQIIKNLLSNSLKFTEKGNISLNVKSLGVNKNKVTLEFVVSDTGIGISKSSQDSIFESFIQANSETSIKYGGSGLGLSISRKLLNLQNSDLKVKSEPGKGADFSFIIKYKMSNRLSIYEPEMIKLHPSYEPLNINVLVAEDNKMNVLILKLFFEKWNVRFKVAVNGKEVLTIIDQTDTIFDIILMDLQMPELDGYETTKIIRSLPDQKIANIPIVALTAYAQTDTKEKTERFKMNGFMSKPFNPMELYSLLKLYNKKDTKINTV